MFFEFLYGGYFGFGEETGMNLIKTRLLGDGVGNGFLVTREHDDFFDPKLVETFHNAQRLGSEGIR